MEVDEIQLQQPCKFSRISNGDNDKEVKMGNSGFGNVGDGYNNKEFLGSWHNHSSRIIRMSRASGGKDRHSKVLTSKGLRDRRVRLSVTTAIQFYDLQDRLGYDQPSKALEWLIKQAADSIAELPKLGSPFADAPSQYLHEKGGSDDADLANNELKDPSFNIDGQFSLLKSGCNSNCKTNKGSGLSLSSGVNRVKARGKIVESAALEKEKEIQDMNYHKFQSSTFTELLTCGGVTTNPESEVNLINKAVAARQWPLTPMDYFDSRQIRMGNLIHQATAATMLPAPENQDQEQQLQQQLPFVSHDDLMMPIVATASTQHNDNNCNLSFRVSSGFYGHNRGTLQSNSTSSPSLLPHLQWFSSSPSINVSTNAPLLISARAAAAAAPPPPQQQPMDHHQFSSGLQLCYGDESRNFDHKGRGKSS